jgi:hypothetical protein
LTEKCLLIGWDSYNFEYFSNWSVNSI